MAGGIDSIMLELFTRSCVDINVGETGEKDTFFLKRSGAVVSADCVDCVDATDDSENVRLRTRDF